MDINNDAIKHMDDSKDYLELVDKLIKPHTVNMDNLINDINILLEQPDYTLDMETLQKYYLRLSTELYIMVDRYKKFDIYSSLSKANELESFNNAYLIESTSGTEGKKQTIKELEIKAGSRSKKESLVSTVYSSAFKTIKSKIDAGTLVADTLKNIIKIKLSTDYATNQMNNSRGAF